MVGGRYAGATVLFYHDISLWDFLDDLPDEIYDSVYAWFADEIGEEIRVEAYFDCGYDESVGLSEYCDLDEKFDPDQEVYDAIEKCPLLTAEQKAQLREKLDKMVEDLDDDAYKQYEMPEPPEPEDD